MKFVSQGWKCSFRVLALEGAISGRSLINPQQQGVTFCGTRLGAAAGRRGLGFASLGSHIVVGSPLWPSLGATPKHRSSPFGIGSEALSSGHFEMAPEISTASECDESGKLPSDPPSEENLLRGFQIVVAATREHGIGKQGTLPWKLPTDMKFFKTVTSSTTASSKTNAVIMGRHTWESIPEKFRPLPGRLNVILTRSGSITPPPLEGVLVSASLSAALTLLATPPYSSQVETVFVIGGGQVYRFTL